ncbi:MAG: hypothetical protein EXX96DRAFT_584765 [Benjaminiella poitrasii]|nr:MAG: hypothetical protein EXX96DRAFT_584765 [Benjaminiella poitrasii]
MTLLVFLLIGFSLVWLVFAEQPFMRYNSGCQLLMNDTRIYCFSGGYAKIVNQEITPLKDHYYLDISKDFNVANTYHGWYKVLDPTDFVSEATTGYISLKLSDTSVLINGGTGINNGKDVMKNQTVIYHADTNEWKTVSNVSSFSQSYYSSGALTLNNTVVFWGGVAAIGSLLPTFNGTAKLLIDQQNFQWSLQPSAVALGYARYGHTATVDKSGLLIYYLGGRDIVRDPTTGVYTRPYHTFTNVLIYHTDTSIWEQKSVSSSSPPSNRMSHTASLIPSTGNIIIYGGAGPDSVGNRIPVTDYLHMYKPADNTFQPISVSSNSINGAGPRFGHSAVIKNNSLFVLFGIDTMLQATPDFHVFNLETNTWQANFYANGFEPTFVDNSTANNTTNSKAQEDGPSDSGLSGGAIAGICVGVIGVIAAVLLFFFIRKRQKQKEDTYPSYWDVTSMHDDANILKGLTTPTENNGSVHNTQLPLDITQLPGYTTSNMNNPANIVNDCDVNPPALSLKVLLPGFPFPKSVDSAAADLESTTTASTTCIGTQSSGNGLLMPPDVALPILPDGASNPIRPDYRE